MKYMIFLLILIVSSCADNDIYLIYKLKNSDDLYAINYTFNSMASCHEAIDPILTKEIIKNYICVNAETAKSMTLNVNGPLIVKGYWE